MDVANRRAINNSRIKNGWWLARSRFPSAWSRNFAKNSWVTPDLLARALLQPAFFLPDFRHDGATLIPFQDMLIVINNEVS
jgi:hypothetical protein